MDNHHTQEYSEKEILNNRHIYEACMSHVKLHPIDSMPHLDPDKIVADTESVFIKNVPAHFMKQFSIVCKAFPELKNDNISLKFRSIGMTMQARPNIWTVFGGQREYFVFINTHRHRNGILLEDIPFNAQIGIIAHELCHIVDYHFKSNWELFKTGLWYLKKRNQENYEKAIDYLVIKKGLGHQLKDWSHFVLHEAPLTDKYKKTKETFYLRPEEIHTCIQEHEID